MSDLACKDPLQVYFPRLLLSESGLPLGEKHLYLALSHIEEGDEPYQVALLSPDVFNSRSLVTQSIIEYRTHEISNGPLLADILLLHMLLVERQYWTTEQKRAAEISARLLALSGQIALEARFEKKRATGNPFYQTLLHGGVQATSESEKQVN